MLLICLLTQSVQGQQMLNPQDAVINYNPASPPVQPAYGKIGKWVRTPKLPWNTTAYKCYIYDSCDFRLHFPQTYQPGDGKKYPILVFYQGDGEIGPITDNESQLKNGGLLFHKAELAGTFDGYIIFMQNQHAFGLTQYTAIRNLIDTLVQEYGGDPYRVTANGLSGGGQAIFNQLVLTPTYFAGAIIMSAALAEYATPADVNLLKFTPMWDLDGGRDNDPTPAQAQFVDSSYLALGSDYVYKNYPTLGHDTWDSTWLEPNFWPFVNNAYLSNPWTLYGKTVFCPSQSFKITIGIVPGLAGYQWRLNGTVIPGATTDSLVVTQPGTYDARVLRGSAWSDWSHVPVQILAQTPAPVADIVQPSCTVSTGTITIAQPKSAGLTYSIDGVHYQTDTAFPKLAAGTYTLTVKNGSTCLSSPTTAVVNPQPVTPAQPTVTITQPSCAEPKGTIVLTSHDTGVVYSIFIGDDFVTYTHFTNLVPGTYHPNVKNGAGCGSAIMVSVVNPAPSTPAAPAVTITQPTCTVGTGTISISSPIDSFTYSINNANYQSGGSFTGVAVGSYKVTAENSEGCISTPSTASVVAPPEAPAAPTLTITQPTCTAATGTIDIAGPPGLLYSLNGATWQPDTSFVSLAPGNYPVTAKDSAGCVSSPASAIILTPPASCNLVISIYPNPYVGEVNFTIVSPESGKGLLLFYNLLGEKMSTWIETDFVAGIPTSIRCPMGFAHRQAVVYELIVGKKQLLGTLLPQKF
jgi:predicted esterase